MTYAQRTKVPEGRSRLELEALLARQGATAFGYVVDSGTAQIAFRLEGRAIRITVPVPTLTDREIAETPTGKLRTHGAATAALEQEVRRVWRALLLIVKAKFEAIETGITTVEREFLADVVIGTGETLGQWAGRQDLAGPDLPLLTAGGGS